MGQATMFVRWKQSRRVRRFAAARGNPDGDVHIACILARWASIRDDGRRGYVFVCYLGSYYASDGPIEHAEFWARVDDRLDGLCLSPEDRATAVTAIASRLPRPTKRQLADAARRGVRAMARVGKAADNAMVAR
jgi:hypothetical protein